MKEWDSWHIMFTSKSASLTKYKQNPNHYCVHRSKQMLVLIIWNQTTAADAKRAQLSHNCFFLSSDWQREWREILRANHGTYSSVTKQWRNYTSRSFWNRRSFIQCVFSLMELNKKNGAMNHLKFQSFVEVMLNNRATEIFFTYCQVHWSEN